MWLMFATGTLDADAQYSAGAIGNITIVSDEDIIVSIDDPFGSMHEFWQATRRARKMGDEAAAAAHSGASKL